jgi:hypothetical protein
LCSFCPWNQLSFNWTSSHFVFEIRCPSIGLDLILSLESNIHQLTDLILCLKYSILQMILMLFSLSNQMSYSWLWYIPLKSNDHIFLIIFCPWSHKWFDFDLEIILYSIDLDICPWNEMYFNWLIFCPWNQMSFDWPWRDYHLI